MTRLLVHVEGQTEEEFVNRVLRDHLVSMGYASVSARIVGGARARNRRGGIRPWPSVKKDILNHLAEDPACVATTMVDYYALPQSDAGAWPGRAGAKGSSKEKGQAIEAAVLKDLGGTLGGRFDRRRFVPFVVMHEFEGLLFSDCEAFCRAIQRPALESQFQAIRMRFSTPEEINDSPDTAPSKRVNDLKPEYQKPFEGVNAALEIGLAKIRQECPHFNDWLTRLEQRATLA